MSIHCPTRGRVPPGARILCRCCLIACCFEFCMCLAIPNRGALLRLPGQPRVSLPAHKGKAQIVAGRISVDTPLSRFPHGSVGDPFVSCSGFTDHAARQMPLCGFVFSDKGFENHMGCSGGMSLWCVQRAKDARIDLYQSGTLPDEWKYMHKYIRIFWSLGGLPGSRGSVTFRTRATDKVCLAR